MSQQILFVGTEQAGHYVPDVSKKSVEYTGDCLHIQSVRDWVIKADYEIVIFELSQFVDGAELLAAEFETLSKVSNALFIFFYIGRNQNSLLVQALLKKGFNRFVTHSITAYAKEELQRCLLGYATIELEPDQVDEAIEKDNASKNMAQTIIAVAGCCKRIGTTTQAIQIVKYLQFRGHTACYIEMNDSRFVPSVGSLYDIKPAPEDLALRKITYNGVDMFAYPDRIGEIRALGYEYLVYDFGSITTATGNSIIQFLEKDIKIIVGGVAPSELEAMQAVLNKTIMQNVYYVFSFVHENDFKEVLELQDTKAASTVFAQYTPDYFVYTSSSNSIYDTIIGASNIAPPPKKKGFWEFGKK